MKPIYLIPRMFKKTEGEIISVENPHADYYIFKIKPDNDITWSPGEHAIISFPKSAFEGKNSRTFSIASIKEDGYLMFATRIGKAPSTFKEYIMHASVGTKVTIKGPFGNFKLQNDDSPAVIFASGIGITAVYPIIRYLQHHKRTVHIVYFSKDYYLFEKEIFDIVRKSQAMDIVFTRTREETYSVLSNLGRKYGSNAYYYNSGPRGEIELNRELLKSFKIKKSHLIDDLFLGYK